MPVSINNMVFAEFWDIDFFSSFSKETFNWFFWSWILNPFCIFLACALFSLRFWSLGEKELKIEVEDMF